MRTWLISMLLPAATLAGAWPQDEPHEAEDAWWSLAPLNTPAVPERSAWTRGPLDAFVAAQLARNGLTPSPEADRRTLLRRVTFDLIGLPPTPEEVAHFLADDAPGAYERVVERLLASPRYGERWARHWLDVAHYGDTHGYDKDKRRPHAWPYRGDFVRAQLAGDVLTPEDADGVIATGFIVAGPWDFVGQVELREGTLDKRIARNLDRDDMVANAMSSFVSTTAHCARCHDHKFDPIPQADYYALQAVFAGVERADRAIDPDPQVARRRRELARRLAAVEEELAGLRARVAAVALPAFDAELARAESSLHPPRNGPPLANTLGYHSAIEARPDVEKWVQVDLGAPRAIERVVLVGAHEVFGGHPGPGFGFVPRFRVEAASDAAFTRDVRLLADHSAADFPHPGDGPVELTPQAAVTGRFVRVTATRLWERTNDYVFALGELAVYAGGANVARGAEVSALDSIEAGESWGRRLLVDGLFARTGFAELGAEPFVALARRAATTARIAELRAREPRLRLAAAGEATRAALAAAEAERARCVAEQAALPAPEHVYAAAPTPDGRPRAIHLLRRGSEAAPGEPIGPGALSALHHMPARFPDPPNASDSGARRAALAEWIASRDNPLTWRSIANRVWHYHFGRGLVATPNDFGRMGARPTHPQLLDWLAARVRAGDQSLKDLQRVIVTSATYRQASLDRPDQRRVDAGNRFLWRMNRRRLEAEALRDALLATSGCLDLTPGGPGFDLFAFEDDHSPRYLYDAHDVEDPRGWRRSIYRTIVRSAPDPLMETFDCADPSQGVPARDETTTALQALALLNNRFVLSQAAHFAWRLEREGATVEAQVVRGYALALGRAPAAGERDALAAHARAHGLASACRVLFNLSEFAYVD